MAIFCALHQKFNMKIVEQKLQSNNIVSKSFDTIDYSDSFLVTFKNIQFQTIDEFANSYFLSQPSVLRIISQNSFSRKSIINDIANSKFQKNTQIGSWKVYERTDSEILFGENMGFMEYRFSMKYLDKTNVEVSTVVKFTTFLAKYYFVIVKLLHKKFVLISLKNIKENKVSYKIKDVY